MCGEVRRSCSSAHDASAGRDQSSRIPGNGQLLMEEDFCRQCLNLCVHSGAWNRRSIITPWGVTVFETRSMLVELNQPKTTATLQQGPGSFYVGNLCAFNHNVKHHADSTGNFIQDEESEQVQLAVMLRSDVYRLLNRASKINDIPGQEEMFRILNTETATQSEACSASRHHAARFFSCPRSSHSANMCKCTLCWHKCLTK